MQMLENTPAELMTDPRYAADKAVRDAAWNAWRVTHRVSGPEVLGQLEREGYFEKARSGDHRGASLFARLVAYRLNPSASGSGFGWLRKGGGQSVDGYAEDAIVSNNSPSDLFNVFDVVAGTGAPGASVAWNGPLPRRSVDTWDAPQALTTEQLAYLKPGSGSGTPGPGPTPTPPVNLQPVLDMLAAVHAEVLLVKSRQDAIGDYALQAREAAYGAKAAAESAEAVARDVRAALSNGLAITGTGEARAAILGTVRGTVTGVAKG